MSVSHFHKCIFPAAILIYFITAVNSHGYYHPDEHFQIIEFAQYKLNGIGEDLLAWEYQAKIRSAVQPALCYFMFRSLDVLGIADPYSLAVCLRMLTAALALTVINIFIRSSLSLVQPPYRKAYILMSYFLWFLPFLHVRFSSETWSGLFFLLAIAVLQQKNYQGRTTFILVGFFLGLSFLFRFQSAILSISLLLWLLVVKKEKWLSLVTILIAGMLTLQIGILIDTWFYGTYVYTCWNYFCATVLPSKLPTFGTEPWYFLILGILKMATYPVGCLILISMLFVLIKKPKSLFIWIIFPFIIVHSFMPHKEIRFLFPIANFVPILMITALQESHFPLKAMLDRNAYKILLYGMLIMLVGVNIAGLSTKAFTSASVGSKGITHYLHDQRNHGSITQVFCLNASLYVMGESFYQETNINTKVLSSISDLSSLKLQPAPKPIFLILNQSLAETPGMREWLNHRGFEKRIESIPAWAQLFYNCAGLLDHEAILVLYSS